MPRRKHLIDQSDVSLAGKANVNQDFQDFKDEQDWKDSHDPPDIEGQAKKNIEFVRRDYLRVFEEELNSGAPTNLPLAEYLVAAYEYQEKHPLPNEYSDWHSPLFQFARLAKAHPDIGLMGSYEAAQIVEEYMSKWPSAGSSADVWEDFFPGAGSRKDALVDFEYSWGKVKFLPGHNPLRNALQKATKCPLQPPISHSDGYGMFVSLAGWLQALQPDPILLPVERVAEVLGVEPRTVSRYRQFAIADGLLEVVKTHTHRPGGRGKATEFRFAVARFPVLQR